MFLTVVALTVAEVLLRLRIQPLSLRIALLASKKIQPHLTNGERTNIFWELAIHYIDELNKAADDYIKLPNEKREIYLKKNTLAYKKYA